MCGGPALQVLEALHAGPLPPSGLVVACEPDKERCHYTRLHYTQHRGANQRMNPDFAESAPKAADFADFWPIFPADKV